MSGTVLRWFRMVWGEGGAMADVRNRGESSNRRARGVSGIVKIFNWRMSLLESEGVSRVTSAANPLLTSLPF